MATPFLIFGTLGLVLWIVHLWLQRSIKRERELAILEHPFIPDIPTCKIEVLRAIEGSEDIFEKGGAGSFSDVHFFEDAKAIWFKMPEEVKDFFDLYPHGVSWVGLGYMGGDVKVPTYQGTFNRLLKLHPEFKDMLIIGGGEGEFFVASPYTSRIACLNEPLDRIDFYESIYELLYSQALS